TASTYTEVSNRPLAAVSAQFNRTSPPTPIANVKSAVITAGAANQNLIRGRASFVSSMMYASDAALTTTEEPSSGSSGQIATPPAKVAAGPSGSCPVRGIGAGLFLSPQNEACQISRMNRK